jgi:hypothetical protein
MYLQYSAVLYIYIWQHAPVGGTGWHFRRGKRCATLPDSSRLARRSTIVDERKEENEEDEMAWIIIMKAREITSLPATNVLDSLGGSAESLVLAPVTSLTLLTERGKDIPNLSADFLAAMTTHLQYLSSVRRP